MTEQVLIVVPPVPQSNIDPETGEIAQDTVHQTPEQQAEALALRMQKLTEWFHALKAAEAAKPLIKTEQDLRKLVGRLWFPRPSEGINNVKLDGGYLLKYTHPIDRKVDEASLTTLRQTFADAKLPVDKLVEWKPSLVKDEYNQLTQEEKDLFDQCLIVKPGSVTLELVEDKKAKTRAGGSRKPEGA